MNYCIGDVVISCLDDWVLIASCLLGRGSHLGVLEGKEELYLVLTQLISILAETFIGEYNIGTFDLFGAFAVLIRFIDSTSPLSPISIAAFQFSGLILS